MLRLYNIRISIKSDQKKSLSKKVSSALKIRESDIKSVNIRRRSLDPRQRTNMLFVYTVDVKVSNEKAASKMIKKGKIEKAPDKPRMPIIGNAGRLKNRPIVIGAGPSGLFTALTLAKNGAKPILLERGYTVDKRTKAVQKFWYDNTLDIVSNVQFGEGGAGTFSDGKLTTLINNPLSDVVLTEMINAGAPAEIRWMAKPHVGTDLLKKVVEGLRKEIISLGGEVRFEAKVIDIVIKSGAVKGVVLEDGETIDCDNVFVCIGHSARDTFTMLHDSGVIMEQKRFAIGLRIEHRQDWLNSRRYGDNADPDILGAAEYKLVSHKGERSVYSFCMCPGGYVVGAASEEGGVVVNGMSHHTRSGKNCNSALLVGVGPEDFAQYAPKGDENHPLSGMWYQRIWEKKAWEFSMDYSAPIQLLGDYIEGRISTEFGDIQPTCRPGVVFAPLKECLPDYVTNSIISAIPEFNRHLQGFDNPQAILTGVETRSSSPVRIPRDDSGQSNIAGLYPVGEGAGYAGGILSSAVDGIKAAVNLLKEQ